MKILFLSYRFSPDIGGIEVHSEILAHFFVKAGHEVRLVTWSAEESNREFPFVIIRTPSRLQLIKEHLWADVVLENNPSIRLAWPQFFLRRPLIIALHTWIARPNGEVSWVDRAKIKRLKQAKKVIACSAAVRQNCWPAAIVIENPYQDHVFKVLPGYAKHKDFVFVGRLVSDKGVHLAIRAIHKLIVSETMQQATTPAVSFTIIGNGPERESLQKLACELGIEKNVTFTGALKGEQLVACLNEHRFLLVPSVWEEPFGMVALEGMACGCIPIVADSGGLPTAVGPAGVIFQRGNVDALVCAIQQVWKDVGLQKTLRDRASDHLLKHRQCRVAKRYLKIIEEVV